jgi:hypothetical protein
MTLGWAMSTSRLNLVRTLGGLVVVRNAKQISCLLGRNRR